MGQYSVITEDTDYNVNNDDNLIQHELFQMIQIYSRKAILLEIIFDFLLPLNIKKNNNFVIRKCENLKFYLQAWE